MIKGVTSEAGLRDYLVLLSLCETCDYQGLDFLDFLRSGQTDIPVFADSRQKKIFIERKRLERAPSCLTKDRELQEAYQRGSRNPRPADVLAFCLRYSA